MNKMIRIGALCVFVWCSSAVNAVGLQQAGADSALFTLEITAHLKNNHMGDWDFSDTSPRTIKAGSSIQIGIKKMNRSTQDIRRRRLEGEAYGYDYEVRDGSGNLLKPKPPLGSESGQVALGGPSLQRSSTIRPGDADIITVSITRLYDLSKPGRYTVRVSQPIQDATDSATEKSNVIQIDVTP